jgi:hypothetical protein
LQVTEDDENQAGSQEIAPYFRIAPWIDDTTPLKSQKETDDGTDEKEGSQEVDFANLLLGGKLAVFSIWVLEEEENDGDGNSAEWQIDPELQRSQPSQLSARRKSAVF